ncbi:hypothetical protein HYDPIDRAFT_98754, partial [Hydnomerulius pinastri MD-312]
NIVLFGESGVGKSSIINTITGNVVASTHNRVSGCTLECTAYPITLDSGIRTNLWDTIGLDEGTAGSIPALQAKQKLKEFLQQRLSTSEGIDLLLFCIRAERIKNAHLERYKFVYEEVCRKSVPVALVVTGLENHEPDGDMDWWWTHNETKLLELGLRVCAHACVTTLPIELFDDDDMGRVDLSRRRLRGLIQRQFDAVSDHSQGDSQHH